MFELYVWGSAFGLPSIDPECLAIISYLYHSALPTSTWRLVPCNDPSITPLHLLPALHHDGAWSSGYRQIIRYLVSNSLCRDLDADLDARQQADTVAYSTYLAAHAAPLIDLSLYVSAANWAAVTRPAYSALLPFPLTWTIPTLIRADAIKRVEHMGLAELDTDFDPNGGLHLSTGRDALPESFRRHLPASRGRRTVREEMMPEQAVAIRLFGLAEDCLAVLNALMREGKSDEKHPRFFTTTPVSSLDCLAWSYLALMVKPQVPRSFLRDWLQTETPRLSNFVDDMMPSDLPWAASAQTTFLGTSARTLDTVLRHAPGIGDWYAGEMRQRAENGTKVLDRRALMLFMGCVVTGVAIGYGLCVYKSLQPFGARAQLWKAQQRGSGLSRYGELGAMLSSAMGAYGSRPMSPALPATGRLVETDSEVE